MGREIERKFLVKDLPAGLSRCPCAPVTQGYLPVENGAFQIRLRREAAKRLLTIKCGHGPSRFEAEFQVPQKDFDSLWDLTAGRRIAKKRYRLPAAGGLLVQLDVYQGKHRGLITAEVEFDSKRQSVRFRAPQWFGREVTGDRHFENATLARKQRR
jgi:CYTH domain-containing protein